MMKVKINRVHVTAAVLILLVVCAVTSTIYVRKKYNIVTDISEVRAEAERLHAEGELEDAISRLEAYCAYAMTDIEAQAILGDWYMEKGDEESAISRYYTAAQNKKAENYVIKPLSVKNTADIITQPITSLRFEISPDVRMTRGMTLTVTNSNLVPENVLEGRIKSGDKELYNSERYLTTDWFDIDISGGFLTMSGGFNTAMWQFADSNGNVLELDSISNNSYRLKDSFDEENYQMARVKIPEGAEKCRVTYFDRERASDSAENDETLVITYGRLPGEGKDAFICRYNIPDLKEGEKIVYENSSWKKVSALGEEPLSEWILPEIERGTYIALGGVLPGRVDFTGSLLSEYKRDGIYTVRFDKNSSCAVGERLDDAKNLGFTPMSGNLFLSLGENDFDNIYPWSDIRLCNISDGKIIYEGEYGFSAKGTGGDVFVEIPKFYSRRTADENYDTVSISGSPQAGFETDEAFLTKDGERDAIYIAAYLSSVDENGCARSVAGVVPKTLSSGNEIKAAAEKNGEGYYEMDYAALFAVQKLFMVESALRNSQYVYMGECALTVQSENEASYSTAEVSAKNTNAITVRSGCSYLEGDGIVIFSSGDTTPKAENIRTVKTVIKNEDNTETIYFSGEPMNIKANVSAIAHIGVENGKTNGGGYHTYSESTARGTTAFKYRNMENIWGDAYVYVDKVSVTNGRVSVEKRNGEKAELSYSIPFSKKDADGNISYPSSMVKSMGYDEANPSVMLPKEIGGATTSTYYGDVICSDKSEEEHALYYGGSWYMKELAGLFSYNALWKKDEVKLGAAGRMMYLK